MIDISKIPIKLNFEQKLQIYLFDENDKIPEWHRFTPRELEKKKRYATIFSFWIDKPSLPEMKVIQFIMREFGVKKSQAYNDLHWVKILLGNVRNASKEWYRYKVIYMLDKAYEMAEASQNLKAMILAADKLGRYTQLDKEDPQKIPYDDIVPQPFEITEDVTVLGVPKISNLKEAQDRMRKKYGGTLIEEAEIVEDDGKA